MNPRRIDEVLTDELEQADYVRQQLVERQRRREDGLPKPQPSPRTRATPDQVCPDEPPMWLRVGLVLAVLVVAMLLTAAIGVVP